MPLFYYWPIGLRFEIGPSEIAIWKDSERENFNEEYFDVVLARSISIFESIFSQEDDIEIIYQQYSDGRKKIRKSNFILKQIKEDKVSFAKYSDVRDIYELDYKSHCWKRLNITNLTIGDINYKNILLSSINSDFGYSSRKPAMKEECYFINKTSNIILNLYDDRGMDVISSTKDALASLYKTHNDFLLNYNRKKVNSVFSKYKGPEPLNN